MKYVVSSHYFIGIRSLLVLPVEPEEWRTTIGSSLASSKVFLYGYGVVFLSPSSISWKEGTAWKFVEGVIA